MAVNTNNIISGAYNSYAQSVNKTENEKTESAKRNGNYGKTVGNVKLSKEAEKYYKELKQKFGNLDFVLVSKDQKENAKANASSFANPNRMVVLIDEEKIEKMATDENYRKQVEATIERGASGMSELKTKLEASGQSDKLLGFGMKIEDNGDTSFFAVLRKSAKEQKERIENKLEKAREERKAEAKEAKAELSEKIRGGDKKMGVKEEDTITLSASTVDELIQKIKDMGLEELTDAVFTESELQVGRSIDFKG